MDKLMMTKRQRQVLEKCLDHFDKEDQMPSERDLAKVYNTVQNTMHEILMALEAKGYLVKNSYGKRKRTSKTIRIYYGEKAKRSKDPQFEAVD